MSDLLKIVKSKLQNNACTKHNKKALISISGETLSFECCCENFRLELIEKTKTETKHATQEMIKNMFKKLK